MYIVGTRTAMASRTLSLDFEKTWRIVDFQTGGPTVSPLLLIYMCWKSNMISDGANHSILLAVHSCLPIHTHYDMCGPALRPMQKCSVDDSKVGAWEPMQMLMIDHSHVGQNHNTSISLL